MPFDVSKGAPQRIAIVGGGIAGLASAWLLSRAHRVTLFEAEPRLGGHARTVIAGRHRDRPVDTGFIVFNHVNYPHLTAMFRDLDVPVVKSDMSFGVSLDGGRVEYALRSANALFGQRRNILDPRFHGMIRDILRFNAGAEAAIEAAPQLTIAQMIAGMRLGARFRDHYLFPFCGAIWSTPDRDIGAFPARALVRFMRNHGLLSRCGQYPWWTVEGGSVTYVGRLQAALLRAGVDLRPGSPVLSVRRNEGRVSLRCRGGLAETFDQIVLATHADQALALLADPDPDETAGLSAIRFQPNRAVLHADPSVMPRLRRCWSSWVARGAAPGHGVAVSYWMNRLQAIPEDDPLFVTLNPQGGIDERLIHDETTFRHPVFDHAALAAQERIRRLDGRHNTWFAGAWLRNGFHEDGFASAMRIARRLLPGMVAL
ncbi:Predicted NAD/FAD-binding protein [Paracoccus halophilus]|uniref:Cyclopropane-fatty-acyl-phospholipid synthase n=1 Tax=Paracoccus halophilus TaxID=376733 RepID=A0A099F6E7_9RHOB|nr:FAD-dependent oxidoreductase [Paracoccus halophilus]KGJ05833.1 cyclopropane-fatty-acyl-phospholipid synthase [Paracoccus halophilus]SFA40824.1 Predicted NAD/FAD-binding protein [Paracoccus halophilus]